MVETQNPKFWQSAKHRRLYQYMLTYFMYNKRETLLRILILKLVKRGYLKSEPRTPDCGQSIQGYILT